MRILIGIVSAIAALAVAVPALAAEQRGATNPWPGKKFDIAFYVETVTAAPGESPYGVNAPQICTQTNFFARGEGIVFHITAINAHKGTIIEPEHVKSAILRIPGMQDLKLKYVPHGADPETAPWTWDYRWDVPLDYPLGVVPFQVRFRLKGWKPGRVATFTQIPISLEQLTIIDHR